MREFRRAATLELIRRLEAPPGLIQILVGPRQVGKTTAVGQAARVCRRRGWAVFLADADALASPPGEWITQHLQQAAASARGGKPTLLAFDELQKIPSWSEVLKRQVDRHQRLKPERRPWIIVTGSSALLVEKGLTESLAGRFEVIRFHHWGLDEEARAFGSDTLRHLALGGYPRLQEFLPDEQRFLAYVRDAIVEPVVNKDILLLHPVEKPVLLRRLFEFACFHPAEIVSLQKMLGQLTDRGNVTIIAHYLDLLAKAFLVMPLQKYSREILRVRASSPKLVVMAQALLSALQGQGQRELSANPGLLGRFTENAVGAHLLRAGLEVQYWRERDLEIDYIAREGRKVMAVEVSRSASAGKDSKLKFLARRLGISQTLVVGPEGVDLDSFLKSDPRTWL